MTPLEKAVEAGKRFSLTYSSDGWRLFDNDVRIEGPWPGKDYALAHDALALAREAAAIRAFLEEAAEDYELCRKVAEAADDYSEVGSGLAGQAAILALKETING